jgi:hypothetical protein
MDSQNHINFHFLYDWRCWIFSCTSSEKFLFNSFAHLLIELFVYLVFIFKVFKSILDINPWSGEWLAKITSHSLGLPFTLVIVSFAVLKLCQFWLLFPKLLKSYSESRLLCLGLEVFPVSLPIVISMFPVLHYRLWAISGWVLHKVRDRDIQFCQHQFLKKFSLVQPMFGAPLLRPRWL